MRVEITNQQSTLSLDEERIERLVRSIFADSPYTEGELSVAVVDDPTIHGVNRRSLDHDYPTDVLSFCLEEQGERLEGEVLVSADTAVRNAVEYGWSASEELLLYVAHGVLHLVGFRDKSDEDTLAMREAEARYLRRVGVECPADHAEPLPTGTGPADAAGGGRG